MIPFLQSVANEIVARYGARVADFLIVLPHKRGVTYMRQYFDKALRDFYRGRADMSKYGDNDKLLEDDLARYVRGVMPHVTSISQHVERISKLKKASHMQLLFTLYSTYRELYCKGIPASADEFEAFRRWGETIISDFNDVDMYDVDADALFRNLADFNDIATDYLTKQQKKVISKYFGVENPGEAVERFWKNFHRQGAMQQEFISLWEKLTPLYHAYKDALKHQGLSYPGMAFKLAAENIETGKFTFKSFRVVYAGFNALSTSERRLFRAVSSVKAPDGVSLADFFWDAPGRALSENSPVDAAHFLRKNAKEFPCSIESMRNYDTSLPEQQITEIACPGNVAQAKVISSLLEQIIQGKGEPYIEPARVAVVLPDEGLLFPVFHSIPADIVGTANITMGYPLRHTNVASFVSLIRQMHARERELQGVHRYFHEDIKMLLGHPLVRAYLGHEAANNLRGYMLQSRLYFASTDEMLAALDKDVKLKEDTICKLKEMFAPLPKSDDPSIPIGFIVQILQQIRTTLVGPEDADKPTASDDEDQQEAGSLTVANIDRYIQVFTEFGRLCQEHKLKIPAKTAVTMACRLLNNETIALQGQPLTGLQIMGMLETRALDFDYLIIPSMNERVFPRRLRPRTFIPDALRIGYGIATTRFQEEIFAYHFYRLIARAKEVYLLYDASQRGMKSGDASRYLLQLRYLHSAGVTPKRITARYDLDTHKEHGSLKVVKDANIQKILNSYLSKDDGAKALSASSLKEYLECPLKFYFSHIRSLKVDSQPTDYMPAYTIGNVLHKSMEYIYNSPLPPEMLKNKNKDKKEKEEKTVTVTREQIQDWLNGGRIKDYANLHELAIDVMRKEYMPGAPEDAPLPGDALLNLGPIETQIRWCLQADMRLAPFKYISSEFDRFTTYKLDDTRIVNMRVIIDRLDRIDLPGAKDRTRIVDYKTGSDSLSFKKLDEIFGKETKKLAIFQLMLYATLYSRELSLRKGEEIALSIYKTTELRREDADTAVQGGDKPINSHLRYEQEFCERLDEVLKELFDYDTPFAPGEGLPNFSEIAKKACLYCNYKNLCNVL